MCERSDAIAAVIAAADRLSEVCETALYGPRRKDDPISDLVHAAFRDLTVTPPDMAMQLRRIK